MLTRQWQCGSFCPPLKDGTALILLYPGLLDWLLVIQEAKLKLEEMSVVGFILIFVGFQHIQRAVHWLLP